MEAGQREFPFDSERKMMSVLVDQGKVSPRCWWAVPTALAPGEGVLSGPVHPMVAGGATDPTELTAMRKKIFLKVNHQLATDSTADLAFAYRECGVQRRREWRWRRIDLCGLHGMIDPPRAEVKAALRICQRGGNCGPR